MNGQIFYCHRLAAAVASSLLCFHVGCGKNMLASGESKDPAQDGISALERDDADAAISIIESALNSDPDNPKYKSILATAYAQRAGIDPLSLMQNMAKQSSTDAETDETDEAITPGETNAATQGNSLTALFSVMPEATSDRLADVDQAISLLNSIAAADRQPGDPFKLAIYQTASMVLHTKALDKNGDGVLTPEEVLDLSGATATTLISQLLGAQSTLGRSTGDPNSGPAAEALARVQAGIDDAPGATAEERLRNYLATQER